jgi:hypothetical protein
MDYDKLIEKTLRSLEGPDPDTGFRRDELAYLALTSKPELPIRDRLAFCLHRTLEDKGLFVAREYHLGGRKHADIAILQGKDSGMSTKVLIELKVSSFFNLDREVHPEGREGIECRIKRAVSSSKCNG